MAKKTKTPKKPKRVYIELTAYWGNGDAESSIKISRRRWAAIQSGAKYITSGSSYYEGEREKVVWSFDEGDVSIDGQDGRQCIVEKPVNSLYVREV